MNIHGLKQKPFDGNYDVPFQIFLLHNLYNHFKNHWPYNQKNEDRYSLYSSVSLFFLRLFFFSSKRTAFYEQLSSLLKADIALYDACVLMRDKFLKHKTLFKSYWLEIKVLDDLIYRISAGLGSDSIASILDGLVPESDLVILSVDSRKTIDAFDQVTLMMSKFNHLRLEVAKMFFTPVASLTLVSVLIFVANWLIFRIVLNIKPFNELPEVTQNLYVFCHFFASNIGLILSILISLILAVIYSLPRLTGLSRKGLDFIRLCCNYFLCIKMTFFKTQLCCDIK